MVSLTRLALPAVVAAAALLVGCNDNSTEPTPATATVRVVNAYDVPVKVVIDDKVVIESLQPGAVGTATATIGERTVVLEPIGDDLDPTEHTLDAATGATHTIAAVRTASGSIAGAVLDDTASTVPEGATKVRVIHLAVNAGELQVYRTQPDVEEPTQWQSPFVYQPDPTSETAPYYQSTAGTWEIRIWKTPADASGWDDAPVKVEIPLSSGQKKTVLILDGPEGSFRTELL